jgi:hypothetical protein
VYVSHVFRTCTLTGDRVELDIYDLVLEEHESDEQGVHGDGDYHQLAVEANKRCVLLQSVLFDQPDLDGPEEVIVKSCIDNQDENLRYLVPDIVDPNERVASGRVGMRWNPDTEHTDVDTGDKNNSAPLEVTNGISVFRDQSDTVDDDLHQ